MALGDELGLRLRLCSVRHVCTCRPALCWQFPASWRRNRDLYVFLCCPVLVSLSVRVASLLVMLLPRLPLHLHCAGLRNHVSLACMLKAHGHTSVTLENFLWTAVSLLGFQLDAFLSLPVDSCALVFWFSKLWPLLSLCELQAMALRSAVLLSALSRTS